MKVNIYLAAPLFTQAERIWNRKLANAIMKRNPDLKIFMPQKHTKKIDDPQKIFDICKEGIDKCDTVLAILDGPDSDSGTCFEVGYAYAKEKNIIGIRTDIRAGEDNGLNIMLSRGCNSLIIHKPKKDNNVDIIEIVNMIIEEINKNN